jgi:hypothetical protein
MPEGEPQQEDFGGSRSRGRHCRYSYRHHRGSPGSRWREGPEQMGARPPEEKRKERRADGGVHFFAAPPPRAATGQQEQEDPRCPRGRRFRLYGASCDGLALRVPVTPPAGKTGTPTTSLPLG